MTTEPIPLEPLNLTHLFLLEKVAHPLATGEGSKLGALQIAQLVFIFGNSEAALAALKDQAFDNAALAFCQPHSLTTINGLVGQITRQIAEAYPPPPAPISAPVAPELSTK